MAIDDGPVDRWYSRKPPEDRRPLLSTRLLWNIFEFRHPFKVYGVSLAVALVGAMAISLPIALRGDDETPLSDDHTAVEDVGISGTTQSGLDIVRLSPISVACNSELAAWPCSALSDDDPMSSWNAGEDGVGAEITFLFSPPVQIVEVLVFNMEDEESFRRNARMRGIEIVMDDLPQPTIVDLEDTNDPQRVQLRSSRTSRVTIKITSAYPGQTYGGREPFPELAAQEIVFYGRVSPDTAG